MTKLVEPPALNLRSAPSKYAEVIAVMPVAQVVRVVGQVGPWARVETEFDGVQTTGFAAGGRLRVPGPEAADRLVREAGREFLRFRFGQGREHLAPFAGFVGEMWRAIGLNLDGTNRDIPWSAAFVSFVVHNAGYAGFRHSASHSKYVHDAIARREGGDAAAPFWGHRLAERSPRLGDLTCQWREKPVDFDFAAREDAFKSHCDVVVQVKKSTVRVIGGNVGDSVRLKTFSLDADGRLKPQSRLFALLGNRASDSPL